MFFSEENRKMLYETISRNPNLPLHIKNEIFMNQQMNVFKADAKPLMELNKAFLISYVKMKQTREELQEIKLSEFENELQKHQSDFDNAIILKKPETIQFNEIKEVTLNESNMEKELLQKMEERQRDMEVILSQQKPRVIEVEQTDTMESKLLEMEKNSSYDTIKKKVSFQDTLQESNDSQILDSLLLEMKFVKQELIELKKLIALLPSYFQSQ